MGDTHYKNRPSNLMSYKGILQLMQSMGHFLPLDRTGCVFWGGEGGGVLPRYTVEKGDSPDISKKKGYSGDICRKL